MWDFLHFVERTRNTSSMGVGQRSRRLRISAAVATVLGCSFASPIYAQDPPLPQTSSQQLRVGAVGCSSLEREAFARLLVLDLKDEGEVIDRPLNIWVFCRDGEVTIRASEGKGGFTVERVAAISDRARVVALVTAELLRAGRWTRQQRADEEVTTEIVVMEPEEAELPPIPLQPKESRFRLGIAPRYVLRFVDEVWSTWGAQVRASARLHGEWWAVLTVEFETAEQSLDIGNVRTLTIASTLGVEWHPWFGDHFGWATRVGLGGGYTRLSGQSNDGSFTNGETSTGVFRSTVATGPRWRFGAFEVGAEVALGADIPRLQGTAVGISRAAVGAGRFETLVVIEVGL